MANRQAAGPGVEPETWDEMVLVGVVARTHGRRGDVVVNPETDFPEERFAPGRTVFIEGTPAPRPLRIRALWFHRDRPVVAFDGIEALSESEKLHGAQLRIPETALRPLPEGTWYAHDLMGCTVRTVQGDAVGAVVAVEGQPGTQRLVVDGDGVEIDVPLVEPICVTVDPRAQAIVIDPPEGLLELNGGREKR